LNFDAILCSRSIRPRFGESTTSRFAWGVFGSTNSPVGLPAQADHGILEVDVAPLQTKHFRQPHSC
jgi:hypothetical protein